MKFISFAVALLLAISHASSLEPASNELIEKRQRAGAPYAITGAKGGVHPRLEIRDLEQTGNMWNLFLLAMADFQAMNQSIIDSYYQIAGIHGQPWTPWDRVQGDVTGKPNSTLGYCPHNHVLFGTWHRPYVILFEQKLQSIASVIASQFPSATRAAYMDAATKLRVPFWDWAKALPTSQPVVPTSMSVEKVQVTFPNGTSGQIDNPLFDYNFHPLDHTQINGTGCPNSRGTGGVPQICEDAQQTIRASNDITVNDNAKLNSNLRSILASIRSSLYMALSIQQTFNQVTTGQFCGGTRPSGAGDLESVHNIIHMQNYPGHMSPSGVAAFDPMFWFHHANVDRHFALWQALYPETWIESCAAGSATYTTAEGQLMDTNTPLKPFHRDLIGNFWTSALARDISTMGYTYPELASNPSSAAIRASINAQYSGPADVPVTPTKKLKVKRQDTTPAHKEVFFAEIGLPIYGLDNGEGAASPYSVLIFLGDVGEDAKSWVSSNSFVGIASTLGGQGSHTNQIRVARVDLSSKIDKAVASGLTSRENVVDHLKKNLHWRVQLGDVAIPKAEVEGLKVQLISTDVEVAQNDGEFDKWIGESKEHGIIKG